MTKETLKRGKIMYEIIQSTEAGLAQMQKLALNTENISKKRKPDNIYADNLYTLCISEHNDGSGIQAGLVRYLGNKELLDVIIKTLTKQLKDYKAEFDSL